MHDQLSRGHHNQPHILREPIDRWEPGYVYGNGCGQQRRSGWVSHLQRFRRGIGHGNAKQLGRGNADNLNAGRRHASSHSVLQRRYGIQCQCVDNAFASCQPAHLLDHNRVELIGQSIEHGRDSHLHRYCVEQRRSSNRKRHLQRLRRRVGDWSVERVGNRHIRDLIAERRYAHNHRILRRRSDVRCQPMGIALSGCERDNLHPVRLGRWRSRWMASGLGQSSHHRQQHDRSVFRHAFTPDRYLRGRDAFGSR